MSCFFYLSTLLFWYGGFFFSVITSCDDHIGGSRVRPSCGRAVDELSGAGVIVVLRLPEAGVGVHGEVGFLQVGGGLVAILGNYGTLLLPAHFLIDGNCRL